MAAAQQNIPSHFPLSVTPDATQKLLRASRFSTCVCMSCLLCLFVWVTSVLSRVVFHIYLYGFIACREYMKEDKEGLYLCVFDQVKGAILWILYLYVYIFLVVLSLLSYLIFITIFHLFCQNVAYVVSQYLALL